MPAKPKLKKPETKTQMQVPQAQVPQVQVPQVQHSRVKPPQTHIAQSQATKTRVEIKHYPAVVVQTHTKTREVAPNIASIIQRQPNIRERTFFLTFVNP